ncbi:MAG TPA: response regulator transcription factor [Terriglobales bacterium]|nr:response regulator transcription factor [Terriglobales bacterium]
MTAENGSAAIRVLISAPSAIRRGGLEALVRSAPVLKLVGSVAGLGTLRSSLSGLQPDIVLVDLSAPDPGLWLAASALEEHAAIVALIDEPDASWAAHALRTRVRAILPRDSSEEEIHSAIYAAHRGLVLLDPNVTNELASRVPSDSMTISPEALDELTPREIEVLRMLAEGLGNKPIAARMAISEHTVKFHISSILDKLGASSRTEAVTLGIRMGLILL